LATVLVVLMGEIREGLWEELGSGSRKSGC